MPTFQTPAPIAVTLDLGAGELQITATDRTDTVVDVRPGSDADESDVKAAQQVKVDYTDGTLRITGPKAGAFDFSRKSKYVTVSIGVPSGSQLSAKLQAGDIRGTGQLGQCQLETSAGSVWLERTGALRLETSAGNVTAGTITGDADIHTGTGAIQLTRIDGTAVIKNSNGTTTIDTATGDLQIRTANGDIHIQRATADVDAKTNNGSIRVDEVVRGSTTLNTATGNLHIGIAEGATAKLDVQTTFGRVDNQLDNTTEPDHSTDRTISVHGHTSYGDITIRRS
ncbi:DUF4097 family beta strand repeat-containing protein [Salinispora arenicola]|uniref:DUF4097 family beta strand repeat-containing protein n=1 Tax=Salinispora arenicola TaxID=168697 RepID=UPI00035CBD80|nr:DUF4097 family beta strand repeat-containing protein [Salinispora arenicola]